MSVFVTDGEQRATLAVVRALGSAGIPVTVGSSEEHSLAGSSRYCANEFRYASPQEHPANFQAQLQNELARGERGYRVALPMTDIAMTLVAQIRDALLPSVRVPIPPASRIEQTQDKRAVLQLAEKVGIASPKTYMLYAGDRIETVAREVTYPLVIKPRLSWSQRGDAWVTGKVRYAHDPAELIALYNESHRLIPEPLVQEKIKGEGRGVFLLVWNGELKAAFSHRRLREKPPWGGVSVLRESIPLEKDLVDKSFALLRELEWQGPAMVEYKVDLRDGLPKLMEINGRFWGSLQLASDAGMNFPLLLYRLAVGENVPSQFTYKPGVKSRWFLGDLDQLLIRLKHSSVANGLSRDAASKPRAIFDFLKFYEPDLHYEIFRLSDPRPGWFEWKAYVQDLLKISATSTEHSHAR